MDRARRSLQYASYAGRGLIALGPELTNRGTTALCPYRARVQQQDSPHASGEGRRQSRFLVRPVLGPSPS
jgi:hypothetical protein